MEHENKQPSIPEQFKELAAREPKPVAGFVAENASEQKQMFLRGEIQLPKHKYARLDAIDFDQQRSDIAMYGTALMANPDMNPKYRAGYEEFIQTYLNRLSFMKYAQAYNHATDAPDKTEAARDYMQANIELYGSPDEQIYRSLLGEKVASIRAKGFTGKAKQVVDELVGMVEVQDVYADRYKPNDETVEWMYDVAQSLYGDMLAHVPVQEEFTDVELQQVFTQIIEEEFGDAAAGWRVVIEKATVVNVKATEKTVVIPKNSEKRYKTEGVRKLIVHELGVHMFRAISGSEVDFNPLETGLPNYLDAEEGLGVIMEQALVGKYADAGVGHYITAGLAYHDHKNFRDIFEVKWRLGVLEDLDTTGEVTDDLVAEKQKAAYTATNRIMRGTDELPWFKDLSYYNGTREMWKHLEAIRGDDVKFMFVLLGKANPANIQHERLMYETATIE